MSSGPSGAVRVEFKISDFGSEMGFRPISQFFSRDQPTVIPRVLRLILGFSALPCLPLSCGIRPKQLAFWVLSLTWRSLFDNSARIDSVVQRYARACGWQRGRGFWENFSRF